MSEEESHQKYIFEFDNDKIIENICFRILKEFDFQKNLNLGQLTFEVDDFDNIIYDRKTDIKNHFNKNILKDINLELTHIDNCNSLIFRFTVINKKLN
jgi:hypothetical protein